MGPDPLGLALTPLDRLALVSCHRAARHRPRLAPPRLPAVLALEGQATPDGLREPGRFSAPRKTETILRMLRVEPLDSLARELEVTAATLTQWREQFLAGGQAALKSRPADERDDEFQRLRAKVGEITMNNELLLEWCHRLEANLPLA
jgi:transposase